MVLPHHEGTIPDGALAITCLFFLIAAWLSKYANDGSDK
jgi:hypothetical protein